MTSATPFVSFESRATKLSKHRVLVPALLALAALVLTGCASPNRQPEGERAQQSGSWSDEVRQEYEKASSPEIKEALRDGVISDQEYAEMKQRYAACLSAAGIALTKYDFGGAVLNQPPSMTADETHNNLTRCSDDSGEWPIAYFYLQMRVNPSNKDLRQAMIDCFKRKGLVGPGYGVKDYEAGDIPSSDDNSVTSCTTDPEGRLGG
ncbi:hypothetical protein G3T36_05780 [Diaminobutyricibacter tongyongensis]|uniref:Uncharacterized protein n=1 Tax=Leifsonia tongyongensis TaxID=1268043 RepID=A0A6L9XVY2_9MICO|nr:hypothetical protein [Diaminobutyricibacter tongyongensis]NEN05377.1 hypothetical protein [Diaminobutyricibacter tongyongensis]